TSPRLAGLGGVPGRHPGGVDAGTAVLVALACLPGMVWEGSAAPAGGLDWLALAALVLPLFWRRRAPVVVFWAVITLTSVSGFFDVDIPAQAIVPAVALYTLARHRPRSYLCPGVGAGAAALGLARLAGDLSWASLAGLSGFFAAATMLGVTIRT